MSGAFNLQTGLVANNGQIPAIGSIVGTSSGGSSCANVNGIVSRQGDCSTDLKVQIGTGLQYLPAGTAGGTLSATGTYVIQNPPTNGNVFPNPGLAPNLFVDGAGELGLNAQNNSILTNYLDEGLTLQYFNNNVSNGYLWRTTLCSTTPIILPPTSAQIGWNDSGDGNVPPALGTQGLQLNATNTPTSVGTDCIFKYNSATNNYTWVADAVIESAIPIGGIIMGALPILATDFPIVQGGATWVLCDGGGIPATPDLRERFIMCEGPTKPYGSTGGSATTTIASINLPPHCHLLGSETVPPVGGGLGSTPNITSGAGNEIPYINNTGGYPGVANVPPLHFQPGTPGGGAVYGSLDARTASTVYGDDAGGNITATNAPINVLNPYYSLYYMMRIS